MQSLTSKGYVKTQFSWQWYYYTLTPEGLDYLREVSRTPRNARPLGEDQMRWMAFFFFERSGLWRTDGDWDGLKTG